jgi:acetylornithine deacetylase
VHASLIDGGQEYSSYPASCVLQGERRTLPGETLDQVERELAAIIEEAGAQDADFAADLRVLASRSAFEVQETEPVVELVRKHAAAVVGADPDVVGVPFWADSALLADAGIPTVLFGPTGEGAHAEVEWVDLASLERCLEIYVAVASELCA